MTKNVPVPPPDRRRFALSDDDILTLARWAVIIEEHYSAKRGRPTPMDMECLEQRFANYRYVPLTTRKPENVDPRVSGYVGKQCLQDYFESEAVDELLGGRLHPDCTHVYLCGNPLMLGLPQRVANQFIYQILDEIEKSGLRGRGGAGFSTAKKVAREARLIVIDPRKIELAKYAACHLQLRPGTNVLLFNALAATIVEEDLFDKTFVAERVSDFSSFVSALQRIDYRPTAETVSDEYPFLLVATRASRVRQWLP